MARTARTELTAGELNSDRFAFRMLFVPKLVGKAGHADEGRTTCFSDQLFGQRRQALETLTPPLSGWCQRCPK